MGGKYLTRAIRTTLFAVFICQLLSTVERQVFDFLGYMWAPIMGNFFQIIVVILGLFGACQHYRIFVVVYIVWSLLWLGWNIFVICLYMEVGILNRNRESYILTFGAETKSWWLEHGIGCKITNDSWEISPNKAAKSSRPIPPEEFVEGCILNYYYVEVIHAAVQIILSLVGLVVASVILYTYLEDEDAYDFYTNTHATNPQDFGELRSSYMHLEAIHESGDGALWACRGWAQLTPLSVLHWAGHAHLCLCLPVAEPVLKLIAGSLPSFA